MVFVVVFGDGSGYSWSSEGGVGAVCWGAGSARAVGAASEDGAGVGVAVADRACLRGRRLESGGGAAVAGVGGDGRQVAFAVCQQPSGRAARRAAAGPAADDHRRAGRGGDHQDAGEHAAGRARTGRRGRWPRRAGSRRRGLADLAGVRAPAAPPGQWKLSKDPLFVEKVRDVVGLYLDPPERARRALRRREVPDPGAGPHRADPADAARDAAARHPRLQAPRHLQPVRRAGPHHRQGHRLAALPPPRDRVQAVPPADRRRGPRRAGRAPRPRQLLHPQDPGDQALAARPPPLRPALHPDQRELAEPRRALVRRAHHQASSSAAAHRSVRELNADIRAWIEHWNDNPRPYVWTKTADQILDSIARYCERINDSRH